MRSDSAAGGYDIVDAKLFALRQCERRSPLPVCTLVWCRPGGSRIMSAASVNRHALALGRGQEDTTRGCARPLQREPARSRFFPAVAMARLRLRLLRAIAPGTLSGLPPSKQVRRRSE